MAKGIVVTPENTMWVHDFAEPLYRTIGEVIGTDIVEQIHPQALKAPFVMIGDEEALLRKDPQINLLGSFLYGSIFHGHPICGTVVFMAEGVNEYGEGEWFGLTDSQISDLTKYFVAASFGRVQEVEVNKIEKQNLS